MQQYLLPADKPSPSENSPIPNGNVNEPNVGRTHDPFQWDIDTSGQMPVFLRDITRVRKSLTADDRKDYPKLRLESLLIATLRLTLR